MLNLFRNNAKNSNLDRAVYARVRNEQYVSFLDLLFADGAGTVVVARPALGCSDRLDRSAQRAAKTFETPTVHGNYCICGMRGAHRSLPSAIPEKSTDRSIYRVYRMNIELLPWLQLLRTSFILGSLRGHTHQ